MVHLTHRFIIPPLPLYAVLVTQHQDVYLQCNGVYQFPQEIITFCVLIEDSRDISAAYIIGDICLGVGIIFLIVSIVQFFQSSKYLNASAGSALYAQKKHRQSLGFLGATRKLMLPD